MTTPPLDDLISLVRRELGVVDVRVTDAASAGDLTSSRSIASCPLPDGRVLVARFDHPPPDVEALQRRLEMICESLRERLVAEGGGGSSRPAPTRTLRDELAALAMRAGGLAAFVIDAHSPVVWGIGGDELPPEDASDILPALDPQANARAASANDVDAATEEQVAQIVSAAVGSPGDDEDLVARAITAVRALPEIETLPRGGHLNALAGDADFGWAARSFAAIYVLVLVFDGPIDELVARRALLHALPQVEQLVLSLPPFEPPPGVGGQMVIRRRARRR